MKAILSERNLVGVLFVLVLITFSLAQEDTRKMERIYSGTSLAGEAQLLTMQQTIPEDHSVTVPVIK